MPVLPDLAKRHADRARRERERVFLSVRVRDPLALRFGIDPHSRQFNQIHGAMALITDAQSGQGEQQDADPLAVKHDPVRHLRHRAAAFQVVFFDDYRGRFFQVGDL
ncbi:MAG: hypothetical protein OXH59_11415 [Rhodospirillaceae bacterium]|nr:hypothetical protein [Rhodospirillaceae bacterium]